MLLLVLHCRCCCCMCQRHLQRWQLQQQQQQQQQQQSAKTVECKCLSGQDRCYFAAATVGATKSKLLGSHRQTTNKSNGPATCNLQVASCNCLIN